MAEKVVCGYTVLGTVIDLVYTAMAMRADVL